MVFSPWKIGNTELKNRWIMLAMHTGFAQSNVIDERQLAFYEARAKGGAAAVTIVLGVNADGSLKGMLQNDTLPEGCIRTLAERIHPYGCKLFVQLFHCGRNESMQAHGERRLLAPSPVASPIFKAEPLEMNEQDLLQTKQDFCAAALRCKEEGADAVEISASAGYLLSEFLSPLTNRRTDQYAYEHEQGMTYPLEVIRAVRSTVGEYTVLLKVSGAQMLEGGYDMADTVTFCRLAAKEIDGITVTGGWHESPVEQISYHVAKGAYAPFAAAIKKYTGLPVIACNRIQDRETAERLLAENACDLVGTARAFLCDPAFANRMEKNEKFLPCQGCNRCITSVLKGKEIVCGFNPEVGKEFSESQRRRVATRKEVVVIGAGPGGMEAAKKAAERGFRTTLITKENALGGQLLLAAKPPKKQDLLAYIAYMQACLEELGVTILLETKCTPEFLLEKKPYLTVIATGSHPLIPEISGAEWGVTASEILSGKAILPSASPEGQIVIIGGGAVGLETAAYLKAMDSERKIKVVERLSVLGKDLGALAKPLLSHLRAQGVQLMTDTVAESIAEGKVNISIAGQKFFLQADMVIFAVGTRPNDFLELTLPLMDERLSYALVGDAEKVGDAATAISGAYDLFTRFYIG